MARVHVNIDSIVLSPVCRASDRGSVLMLIMKFRLTGGVKSDHRGNDGSLLDVMFSQVHASGKVLSMPHIAHRNEVVGLTEF